MKQQKRRRISPADLSPAERFEKALSGSLYYLTRRERTEKQVREYLTGKEYPKETADAVVGRLKELGYLDDSRFAERYAQLRQKKGGRRKVRLELLRSGIDRETAENAVQELDEAEEAANALAYARKALHGQTDEKARQRAFAALARRGYDAGVIRSALRQALLPEEDGKTN